MPFFLVGPTAVGKTALAIELAEQFDAEIVNADAFQVYRGLDVLTAKPDAEAQRRVRHHVLSQISLFEIMSAASFRELACAALSDVHSRKKNAIGVGGGERDVSRWRRRRSSRATRYRADCSQRSGIKRNSCFDCGSDFT